MMSQTELRGVDLIWLNASFYFLCRRRCMMESISDQICLDEPRKQNNISHCKANLTEKFDKIRQQLGEKRIFGNLIVCQFMLLSS